MGRDGRQGHAVDGLCQKVEFWKLRGDRCGMVWAEFVGQGQIGLGDFGSICDKGIVLGIGQNINSVPSGLFQQTGKGLWRDIGPRQAVLVQSRFHYLCLFGQYLCSAPLGHGCLVCHGGQNIVFQLIPEWIRSAGGSSISLGRQIELSCTRSCRQGLVASLGRRCLVSDLLSLAGFLGLGSRARGFGDGLGAALGAGGFFEGRRCGFRRGSSRSGRRRHRSRRGRSGYHSDRIQTRNSL
mmetsp:Transcript_6132/g.14881  ORF Transcript_6132/g.14881 Transcript_6132/m.14881 type:complete len:239 (-) Transcript_6132:171-887(-)